MMMGKNLIRMGTQAEALRRQKEEEAKRRAEERRMQQEAARREREAEAKRRAEEARWQREARAAQSQTQGNGQTAGTVKNTQGLMNSFGFTDGSGRALKVDGVLGAKTMEAVKKFERYQTELEKPSQQTLTRQRELNKSGIPYLDGQKLKEDGIWGPKTDYVKNAVDNAFTGWLMDNNYVIMNGP